MNMFSKVSILSHTLLMIVHETKHVQFHDNIETQSKCEVLLKMLSHNVRFCPLSHCIYVYRNQQVLQSCFNFFYRNTLKIESSNYTMLT
jgi:hypothetical protein